jgi:hypothetical protein
LKTSFEEVIFSSNIFIRTPKSSRDGEKREEEKEKLQESLQIKGKIIF